jgi:hypothetical protein
MLRLTFADLGELPDAQAAITTLRDWAVSLRSEGMAVLRGYQAGQAPFPDRLHLNVLTACYSKAIYDATIAFCDLAQKEIAGWDRTDGLGHPAHPRPARPAARRRIAAGPPVTQLRPVSAWFARKPVNCA